VTGLAFRATEGVQVRIPRTRYSLRRSEPRVAQGLAYTSEVEIELPPRSSALPLISTVPIAFRGWGLRVSDRQGLHWGSTSTAFPRYPAIRTCLLLLVSVVQNMLRTGPFALGQRKKRSGGPRVGPAACCNLACLYLVRVRTMKSVLRT
jgi:hypothetical protein